jgi:hypothetical protein
MTYPTLTTANAPSYTVEEVTQNNVSPIDIEADVAIREAWMDLKRRCTHPRKEEHTRTEWHLPAWDSRTGPIPKSNTFVDSWTCLICDGSGRYNNNATVYPC